MFNLINKLKNLSINKKVLIIVGLTSVLIIFIIANVVNMQKHAVPTTTPAPGQTLTYQGLTPGVATKEDVVSALGSPINTEADNGFEVLDFESDVADRPHQAYIDNEKLVLFKETIKWSKNIYDVQKVLGTPKYSLYTSDVPGSFEIYIYPNNGVAYIGHPKTTTITDIWYFVPMSFDDFKNTWGKDFFENVITDPSNIPPGRR